MRRRLLWGGLGIVLLVAVGLGIRLAFWLSQSDPAPVQAYGRIRLGMTPEQVEAAIGQPSGNYQTKPVHSYHPVDCVRETGLSYQWLPANAFVRPVGCGQLAVKVWVWDDYGIWVAFDGQERASGFYLLELVGRENPGELFGPLHRVRAWFGF